ncbi:MAG: Holliday junction branch migration protein RuvA [Oscillospiraceae bacterium]|nr:Holliday junction branch migration protein RuvA [Oscillospiraceae bacterium]
MFEYLNGNITCKRDNYVVVDIGGLGYKCYTSAYTHSQVDIEKVQKLYIYPVIREDVFDLYGFSGEQERAMFANLISISGVGPKAALSVLSILEPSALALAIVTNDDKAISKASGIGAKTAARICLELGNKLVGDGALGVPSGRPVAAPTSDAEMALLALGFGASEIRNALKNIEGNSTDEIIRKALIELGRL